MIYISQAETVATVLVGQVSPETAYVVDGYPYGMKRTQKRYWIETKKGFGQRMVTQTLNPKTNKWNATKPGTYSRIVVMYLDKENGYVQTADLDTWDTVEVIKKFVEVFALAFENDEYRQKQLAYVKAMKKVEDQITWTVTTVTAENENEPHQTMKEQAEILHRMAVNEMVKAQPKTFEAV